MSKKKFGCVFAIQFWRLRQLSVIVLCLRTLLRNCWRRSLPDELYVGRGAFDVELATAEFRVSWCDPALRITKARTCPRVQWNISGTREVSAGWHCWRHRLHYEFTPYDYLLTYFRSLSIELITEKYSTLCFVHKLVYCGCLKCLCFPVIDILIRVYSL